MAVEASGLKKLYLNYVQRVNESGVDKNFYPDLTASHVSAPKLPAYLSGSVIYEIYPRSYSQNGTLSAVQNDLVRLQESGINTIWLMPVYPIGQTDRKGTLGCPYAVRDYFTIDPGLGTMDDFRRLVKKTHQMGMHIILDLVVNHVAHDYSGFEKNPKMALRDKTGNPTRKVADWTDVVDLDYTRPVTRRHVEDIMDFWMRTGIDGFRCDVAGMVPVDFWEQAAVVLRKKYPGMFLLAEWQSPRLHKAAFNCAYDWVLYELMLDVKRKKQKASVLLDWVVLAGQVFPKGTAFLRFIENHDLRRAVKVFGEKGFVPFLVFIFCVDGIPLVYNGQEIGAKDYLSLFEPQALDWKLENKRIKSIYTRLLYLRKHFLELSGKKIRIHSQADNILIFEKENILVILNFKKYEQTLSVREKLGKHILNGTPVFNSNKVLRCSGDKLWVGPFQSIIIDTDTHAQQIRTKI